MIIFLAVTFGFVGCLALQLGFALLVFYGGKTAVGALLKSKLRALQEQRKRADAHPLPNPMHLISRDVVISKFNGRTASTEPLECIVELEGQSMLIKMPPKNHVVAIVDVQRAAFQNDDHFHSAVHKCYEGPVGIMRNPRGRKSLFRWVDSELTVAASMSAQNAEAAPIKRGLGEWSAMIIKFATRRELHRWKAVFCATQQTAEWLARLRSFPCFDLPNVLINRVRITQTNQEIKEKILPKVNKKLRKIILPSKIKGKIRCIDINVDDKLPRFDNFSQIGVTTTGEISADFDLRHEGLLSLQFVAKISFNNTQLPTILLTVLVKELKGRIRVNIDPPPVPILWIAFHTMPMIVVDIKQEVMEKALVVNSVLALLPDMSAFATQLIRSVIAEDMVLPNMDDVPLPRLGDSESENSEEEKSDEEERKAATVPTTAVTAKS